MSIKTQSPMMRAKSRRKDGWNKDMKKNWILYLIFIPAAAYFIVFNYVPMVGIVMAFQKVSVSAGIFGSPWNGWDNFVRLFTAYEGEFARVMRNTSIMALMNITIGFVMPIILALLVSEVRGKVFRRTTQTITYMPYFISAVVIVQLVKEFVDADGAITSIFSLFGMKKTDLLTQSSPPTFWLINCFTDIWQTAGYSSIIFVAAIASVSKDLYEASALDGANRFQRIMRITLPSILPTIVMMFTIKVGTIFTTGFDKVLLMYNDGIWESADVLTTYTYRMAFTSGDFGLSAASGLFQSVIATALLFISNGLSRLATKTSLI